MLPDTNRQRPVMIRTVALLAGFAVITFGVFWLVDYFFVGPAMAPGAARDKGPLAQLFHFDAETLQNALGNLAQVIAAVLGIAITVVSIVVQLAATRYTSRVADMFFRDRTNLVVMGFFVVACINAVWASLSVTRDYVPQATIVMTVVVATGSLLILMPYFAYVFDFLDPEKIIARIGQQTLDSATGKRRAGGAGGPDGAVAQRQSAVVARMEQLTDIAINALAQKDKVIASGAIAALRRTLVAYLPAKRDLPPPWFAIGPGLRDNPDFVALAKDSVADLARRRIWLEWKALRQLRAIFSEALASLPEMAHVVAIETRYAGEAALAASEREVLALVIKFMNTYLRATLNTREVRSAYNVLNQYRQLAEAMMRAPANLGVGAGAGDTTTTATEALIEIGGHFKYYAQLARRMDLGFITETAAYDLGDLCERAADAGAACHDRLLAILLEIDKEPETPADERALRGVRKAQAKLATYYLERGMGDRARAIHADMLHESPERLRSIRDEMLAITAKDFWEVVDRGTNFDYLDDTRKERLREFFGWFGRLEAPAPPTAVA